MRRRRGKGSEAGQLHDVIYNVQVGICGMNTAPQPRSPRLLAHLNSVRPKHPPVFWAFASVGETRLLMTTGFFGTLLRTTELLSVLSCSASALRRASAACWGLLGCICCSGRKRKIFPVWKGDQGSREDTLVVANAGPNEVLLCNYSKYQISLESNHVNVFEAEAK